MKCPFKKYKDVEISEIAQTDPAYLEWALQNAIDINHPKYGESNRKLADEIKLELARVSKGQTLPETQWEKEDQVPDKNQKILKSVNKIEEATQEIKSWL